jgi:DNA-binding transcriptional ArsR family regulator
MKQEILGQNQLMALADPTRHALLQLLRGSKLTVGELAEHLPVSRPAVSQHLQVLSAANLVKEDREGTRHYFSLKPEGFSQLQAYISTMWQDALDSFSAYVGKVESRKNRLRRAKRRKK